MREELKRVGLIALVLSLLLLLVAMHASILSVTAKPEAVVKAEFEAKPSRIVEARVAVLLSDEREANVVVGELRGLVSSVEKVKDFEEALKADVIMIDTKALEICDKSELWKALKEDKVLAVYGEDALNKLFKKLGYEDVKAKLAFMPVVIIDYKAKKFIPGTRRKHNFAALMLEPRGQRYAAYYYVVSATLGELGYKMVRFLEKLKALERRAPQKPVRILKFTIYPDNTWTLILGDWIAQATVTNTAL